MNPLGGSNSHLTALISECDDHFNRMNQQYKLDMTDFDTPNVSLRYHQGNNEDSEMTLVSPDKKIREEQKHSQETPDSNYEFLATASLMKSQYSPREYGQPRQPKFEQADDHAMHTAEKARKNQRQVEEEDISSYLM